MTDVRVLDVVVRPVLVGTLIACIMLSVVILGRIILPGWDGTYLVVFCALTAIEAMVSYRIYRHFAMHIYGGIRFRVVEWAILFVLLQLADDVATGHPPFRDGLPRVDDLTIFFMIPVILCWLAGRATADDLAHLDEPPEHHGAYVPPRERLARRFFAGGFVLFLAAGLTQVRNEELLHFRHVDTSGPILNVLAYFVLGLILLVQVRYEDLSRLWRREGALIPGSLAGRWLRYSALFLAIAAILAFLLPTSYTFGLLDIGRAVLGVLTAIAAILISLVTYPIALLLSLFQHPEAGHPVHKPVHFPPPPPQHHSTHKGGISWLVVRSVLFWLVTGAVVVYLLRSYLQQHRVRVPLPALATRLLALLASLWGLIRRGAVESVRTMRALAPSLRRPAKATPVDGRERRLRLGRLSPRGRIIYYFLSTVRRAEGQGLVRRPSQTPLEWEQQVAQGMPDAGDDMAGLTRAYLEAQYSDHPIGPQHEGTARTYWERLRRALRRRLMRANSASLHDGGG